MQRWKGRGGALECRHSPKQPQTDPRPPTAVVGTARGLQSKVGPRKVQHGQPPSGAGIQGQGQLKTEETANTPLTVEVQACGGGRGRGGLDAVALTNLRPPPSPWPVGLLAITLNPFGPSNLDHQRSRVYQCIGQAGHGLPALP